jgi:FG-GAP-like repeat
MKQKLYTSLSLSGVLSSVTLLSIVTSFTLSNHANAQGFCTHQGAYKISGDFDGDRIKDTLCTDSEGRKWIAYGNGRLWENLSTKWCSHGDSSIRVGDFNGDGRSDLLCHDLGGRNWIVYANAEGNFGDFRSGWTGVSALCTQEGNQWYVKDLNGDGRADIVCIDNNNGKWYRFAKPDGTFDL